MSDFRIVVADGHPVFRLGLCALLGPHPGWVVCGEAADGVEAVEKCGRLKPDLVIVDIYLPKLNGADAARQILKEDSAQKVLVLTNADSEQAIRDCLEAGVRGWVFKSDSAEELTSAVDALQRGRSFFSTRVSELIMHGYLKQKGPGVPSTRLTRLTPREREVVQLVSEGKTSKQVAAILNVAVKTAETHRSNVMVKLNLHSVADLVLYAVRNEIVHVQLPTQLSSVLRFPQPANGGGGPFLAGA